jgi:hypothetical protein
MLFRVDSRPCAESVLKRCPGEDPDSCSCIRNVTLPEDEWASQKFTCTDFNGGPPAPGTSGNYWVTSTPVKDTSVIYYDGPVEVPGGQFNATAPEGQDQVDADTFLNLFACNSDPCTGPGSLLQQIVFHSSCSKELYLLDIFGSFQLIEFESTTKGVIGYGVSPTIGFSVNLMVEGSELSLDFITVVILSNETGLLPPQMEQFALNGTLIPPSFNESTTATIIPNQNFNVMTTIGGQFVNADGTLGAGCFDIQETVINCPTTIEPTITTGPTRSPKSRD